jgi:hypothetical protein
VLRLFLRQVRDDWVALLSGIASVILAFVGAVLPTPVPAWAVWPVAYACLLVAAYRVWRAQHLAYLTERAAREEETQALRRDVEALRRDVARARRADGAGAAIRHHLEGLLSQFRALAAQVAGEDRGAAVRVYPLEFQTARYLQEHLPQYRGFEAGCPVKDTVPHEGQVNLDDARRRCEERIARLTQVLELVS